MQLKKIIVCVTMICFTSSTLVGCVGQYGQSSTQAPKAAIISAAKIAKDAATEQDMDKALGFVDGPQDNRIWLNTVAVDGKSRATNLSVLVKNDTKYKIEAMGVISGNQYVEDHLQGADAQSSYKEVPIPAKYQELATKLKTMPDPAHIYDSYLKFKDNIPTDKASDIRVLYRVWVPEASQYMYFVLKNHIYQMATKGANASYKPNNDNMNDWTLPIINLFSRGFGLLFIALGHTITFSARFLTLEGTLFSAGCFILGLGLNLASTALTLIGLYNTLKQTSNPTAATSGDIVTWNNAHPDQLIVLNTVLTALDTKNSTYQQYKLAFNDPKIDKQIALQLELSTASTPWNQAGQKNADTGKVEDILVNRSRSEHVGDSVLLLSASTMGASADKDQKFSQILDAERKAGAGSLADDKRYDAPSLAINQIRNTQAGAVLYSDNQASQTSSGAKLITGSGSQIHFGAIPGLVINHNQSVSMGVTIAKPVSSIYSEDPLAPLAGQGLAADYYEQSMGNDLTHFEVAKSEYRKEELEEKGNTQFLYSKFSCDYPYIVGSSCPLSLSVAGADDGKHHQGKIYVSDVMSKTTALPVYMNYELLADSNTIEYNPMPTPVELSVNVWNYGSSPYSSLVADGDNLPSGVTMDASSCSNLAANGQASCQVKFKIQPNARAGSYQLLLRGITQQQQSSLAMGANLSQLPEKNSFPLTLIVHDDI